MASVLCYRLLSRETFKETEWRSRNYFRVVPIFDVLVKRPLTVQAKSHPPIRLSMRRVSYHSVKKQRDSRSQLKKGFTFKVLADAPS